MDENCHFTRNVIEREGGIKKDLSSWTMEKAQNKRGCRAARGSVSIYV